MASGKGLLINALGGLLLREGQVTEVREVSSRFRWLHVHAEVVREATWTPGDKVQVLLPDLDTRTFTPIGWDRTESSTDFLLYLNQAAAAHDEHPGTRFIRTVQAGDRFRFIGPQPSLAAPAGKPLVLFGDETSFAVALALKGASPTPPACVFEVESASEAELLLAQLGLPDAVCIERTARDAHLRAVSDALERDMAAKRDARLLMTGRAQAIQALQRLRRTDGRTRAHKTKAYWSLGRVGLD